MMKCADRLSNLWQWEWFPYNSLLVLWQWGRLFSHIFSQNSPINETIDILSFMARIMSSSRAPENSPISSQNVHPFKHFQCAFVSNMNKSVNRLGARWVWMKKKWSEEKRRIWSLKNKQTNLMDPKVDPQPVHVKIDIYGSYGEFL